MGLYNNLTTYLQVIGNQKPEFIDKRRLELEKYLQNAYELLKGEMPREFVEFLHYDEYDRVFLLQKMAHQFATHIDHIAETKKYAFSMLEMFAISSRLRLPCSPQELTTNLNNFSHVLDFCMHLENLIVVPTKYTKMDALQCEDLENFVNVSMHTQSPIGTSNIIPQNLQFNLSAFRNLKNLTLLGVPPTNIESLGKFQEQLTLNNIPIVNPNILSESVRPNLESFRVYYTNVSSMSEVLLCDVVHKTHRPQNLESKTFAKLRDVHFCNAALDQIDDTALLIPNTVNLSLNGNAIQSIDNLQCLSNLEQLSLRKNNISVCVDWHVKFGNIVTLNLSENKIVSLMGLRKLFCLVNLNLSGNQIADMAEVDHLAKLPNLEHLILTGNPLCGEVDYRVRVLSRFTEKVEFHLDNERAGQREMDTAGILAALRQSKGITTDLKIPTDLSFSP